MSEIKVNSIKGVGATDAAITVNNSDGTCTANITNNLSNRNLIINGDMRIAQRGTSSTSTGYYTVDRFALAYNATASITQAQVDVASGTTPYSLGFRKAFKATNGNQGSLGSQQIMEFKYKVEAQDVASSGWNYTDPNSFITLSFWVKSSVSFNMKGFFFTQDNSYNYPLETGTLSANTWTKIIRTIPGNSNLVFNNDNGHGLTISWGVYGTNYSSGNPAVNQWVDYSAATLTNPSETTWYTTNDATLEFTGLQLEVGDTATSFEHRSYGDELRRCERYFQCLKGPSLVDTGDNEALYGIAFAYTTYRTLWSFIFKTEMRDHPTIAMNTIANLQGLGVVGGWNAATQLIYTNKSSKLGCRVDLNWSGNPFTAGHAVEMRITGDGLLSFSAEL